MTDKKLYNAKEAAAYCDLSYKYIRDLTRAGEITHHAGGTEKRPVYHYEKQWLDEFLAKRLGPVVKADE